MTTVAACISMSVSAISVSSHHICRSKESKPNPSFSRRRPRAQFSYLCCGYEYADLYTVWTALEAEGLGCNLQHYHDMIGADLNATWNIPPSWKPKSQLVFGKPLPETLLDKEKTFRPSE